MSTDFIESNPSLTPVRHPSDSAVQRSIEIGVLERLGASHPEWKRVEWSAASKGLGLAPVWQQAQPDAAWSSGEHEVVVAECYCRIGVLEAGHRRKLALDALKLVTMRSQAPDPSRLRCLLVVPDELAGRLVGEGWFNVAVQASAELVSVTLSDDERRRLVEATRLQAAGQARSPKSLTGEAPE